MSCNSHSVVVEKVVYQANVAASNWFWQYIRWACGDNSAAGVLNGLLGLRRISPIMLLEMELFLRSCSGDTESNPTKSCMGTQPIPETASHYTYYIHVIFVELVTPSRFPSMTTPSHSFCWFLTRRLRSTIFSLDEGWTGSDAWLGVCRNSRPWP